MFLLASIIVIVPSYIFIKAYINNNLKTPKLLFYSGILFYIVLIIHFISEGIYFGLYCHYGDKYLIFDIITQYLYPFQGLILVTFLFIKLVFIFKSTEYAISKITIILYSIITTIAMSSALFGQTVIIFQNLGSFQLGLLSVLTGSCGYIFLILWLNVLFLYKLSVVYKMCKEANNKNHQYLIKVITKTAVLCFVSTVWIILFLISYFMIRISDSVHIYLISRVLLIGDIYTSFASIFLSYDYFDTWYFKIFGCCHHKCHSCLVYCANKDEEFTMKTIIRLQASTTTTKTIDETNKGEMDLEVV